MHPKLVAVTKTKEFLDAFAKVFRSPNRPLKIGLAISGGSDSMALAYACQQLKQQAENRSQNEDALSLKPFNLVAFIVDHRARPESTAEANLVSDNLKKLGIKSSILPIEWPQDTIPLQLRNFEQEARKLRYQALGRACVDHGITHLCTAHQKDDQVETILQRLMNAPSTTGLHGMFVSSDIPECHGIFGAHKSGRYREQPQGIVLDRLPRTEKKASSMYADGRFLGFATGGVTLFRPLLGMSKTALVSICEVGKVPWVEDPTNSDKSLSNRNTIRSLLKQSETVFPQALHADSLLSVGKTQSQRLSHAKIRAERAMARIQFHHFFPSSGLLQFSVPQEAANMLENDSMAALELVAILAKIVSPLEHVALRRLQSPAQHIFPDMFNDPAEALYSGGSIKITAGGVLWHRLGQPEQIKEPTWLLSRQDLRSNETPPMCVWDPQSKDHHGHWSWQLFDGRFWIRASQRSRRNHVKARLLKESDMKRLREDVSDDKMLEHLLHKTCPGHVRWGVPALVDYEKDFVLALPTLEISTKDHIVEDLQWQVLYKDLDFLGHMDVQIPTQLPRHIKRPYRKKLEQKVEW